MIIRRTCNLYYVVCLLSSLLLTSCATMSGKSDAKVTALWSQWGEENKRQHQALGERIYDKDYDLVFTATVTAFADMGFSVKNMERQSGYILAEGPSPLSAEREAEIGQRMVETINQVSPRKWFVTPGNATKAATMTIIRLGEKRTKVKMRVSTVAVGGDYSTKFYSIYPSTLEAEYQQMWRGLEKQIFLDEHLDKMKP